MVSESTRAFVEQVKTDIGTYGIDCDRLEVLRQTAESLMENDNEIKYGLKITAYVKSKCVEGIMRGHRQYAQLDQLNWDTLRTEARHWFESFLLYMERKRRPEKKFYEPRMATLHVVAMDLQDLEDGKLDFLGISLPPRVGKSTLCIFFMPWVIGRHSSSHNAMSGHSGILADRFYTDVFKLTESDEYTFHEIFPEVKKPETSAEKNELKYDKVEAFATLTCRGIDGTWTGAVDISSDGYLYVDDMVRDRTESLSPIRLEKRYQDYLNVLVDRKNDGAKELMVGTRWNVLDILGRMESKHKDNPRYRFRKIPALNEKGESNFQYKHGVGFSTKYYQDMKARLDKNEWEAKYQQRPFIREGLLFPEDELRFYNGVLPDGDHYTVAACDVAWGGGDSLSMPVGVSFGRDGDIYIPSWVFNRGDKNITKPLVAAKIAQNEASMVRFEANNGGDEFAEDVETLIKAMGYKTNISWKKADNRMSKLAKIIQYAPDIKQRCVFLAPQYRDEEYQRAMDELEMFVQIGENEHDDAADGLSQLIQLIDNSGICVAQVINSPV